MNEFRTSIEYLERRTYLKGRLKGKYFGFLDHGQSDLVHENFYSIEIVEAEVQVEEVQKWQDGGSFDDFKHVDFFSSKLPASTPFNIKSADGTTKYYFLDLREVKAKDIELKDVVYEDNKVFGTIEARICGYVLRLEPIEVRVPIDSNASEGESRSEQQKQSGTSTTKGSGDAQGSSFWETTSTILQALLSIAVLLPLIYTGWPFLLLIGASFFFYVIGQVIQPVFRYVGGPLISLIWILFLPFAGFALFGYLSKSEEMVINPPKTQDLPEEKTNIEEAEDQDRDSTICHYRVWEDYSGGKYDGYLKIRLKDWISTDGFHRNAVFNTSGIDLYNQVLYQFAELDSSKLHGVYSLFDTLRARRNLDKKAFAEVIVSCIQDIPYTLILDNACDPLHYNDRFIEEYLNQGGICHPNVKYGIFSPVEFMATLHGDCDTRALLLFVILNHYGYDVLMLSSEVYRHATIAINLPYLGTAKISNGKRYIIWETTQKGIPPGVFSLQMSKMDLWNINLTSNKSVQ